MGKRALVISGGGAKGAFAGGLAKKLYEKNYRWDMFYGTSTGALLNTLIPLYDFDTLKEVYTSVTNRDIFNKPPFNQRGRLNILRSIWRTVIGKTSIGKANNLLKLIRSTYTEDVHNSIIKENKLICSCVTNFTLGKVEYGYNTTESYDDFVRYTFASASVPIAMGLVDIKGMEYLDGGVMEHIPLKQAIKDGAKEIDVIILRPNYSEIENKWKSKNVANVAMRSLELLMKEISESDVIIGKLKSFLGEDITINLYFVPDNLTGNSLVFDPAVMRGWWESGYNTEVPEYSTITTKSSGLTINEIKL